MASAWKVHCNGATLAEAATIADTSIDTIRRKLRKGELEKGQTNRKGAWIDLASLREAFDLPSNAGQASDPNERAQAEASLQQAIKALEATVAEMRLQAAQSELKHREELTCLETKLAVADTLATQRQAEIERLHEICKASAQQVLGIRMALRQWVAKRLAA